ncbi:MAG: hypothetical protein H0U25_11085 [Thermoleophilaceae bacterium]|nr:hypothetical protein [Thermoleophilaceae bacterium]
MADDERSLLPSDRLVLRQDFDVSAGDLAANAEVLKAYAAPRRTEIHSIQWFVPGFYLVWGGGVHTLLRFADHVARRHGVESRFCVFDDDDPDVVKRVRARIAEAFPALAGSPVTGPSADLEPCDAAVATAWEGIWRLVRFRDAAAKFVFVQDWEPDFLSGRLGLRDAHRGRAPGDPGDREHRGAGRRLARSRQPGGGLQTCGGH